MTKVVFFDTETTGLPLWQEPSDSEGQPHLTQLAAIVADAETKEVLASIDLTIRPDGWVIPAELVELNGLTTEYCAAVGVSEKLAVDLFFELVSNADLIVAHNSSFDQRIIRIAMKRYGYSDADLIEWAAKDKHFCTMRESKEIVGALTDKGSLKNPNLSEAYQYFYGEGFEGAHTALADATACMKVYWALTSRAEKEFAIEF